MFEARLIQGEILKKIVDSIKDLITEANLNCNPHDGLSLQAMDGSHVSLVSMLLKPEAFDRYKATRAHSLGITLTSIAKVMKCAKDEDTITLKVDDVADSLILLFEAPNQQRISHFNLKLMDIESENMDIPETKYECQVKLPSAEFHRICKEMTTMGDTVRISVSKEGIKFSVTGDLGTGTIVCRQNSESEQEAVSVKVEEPLSLEFALRYLNMFCKATPMSTHVVLKLSPNIPLIVEYSILDTDVGHIRFYLAPKMEEEITSASS